MVSVAGATRATLKNNLHSANNDQIFFSTETYYGGTTNSNDVGCRFPALRPLGLDSQHTECFPPDNHELKA
jgi:hypothetical protein